MNTARFILIGLFVSIVSFTSMKAHADVWFSCIPVEIIEFASIVDAHKVNDRIHVKCSNSWGSDPDTIPAYNIKFIAIDKSDVAKAERFISLANTALACGYIFRVFFSESAERNVNGCHESDCRTPSAFGVMK